MRLYLIRHAQSWNNARPEHERVEDPGLTEMGHEQARCLAAWIPRLHLTQVYVSPFRRTLETALPLAEATGLAPRVRVDLHEQGGCYAGHEGTQIVGRPGMGRDEIRHAFPLYDTRDDVPIEGWWQSRPYEGYRQACQRAASVLEWIQAEWAGSEERVAFVTHADFKVCLLRQIHPEVLQVPYNTSISEIVCDGTNTRLQRYNDVEHLGHLLVTD